MPSHTGGRSRLLHVPPLYSAAAAEVSKDIHLFNLRYANQIKFDAAPSVSSRYGSAHAPPCIQQGSATTVEH
eukprot:1148223-Amphidinium_carterae.1